MNPKSIGIIAGAGGPISSLAVLQEIVTECQQTYGSWRSYEYPCINFYSYPYSEMMVVQHNNSSVPKRELSFCIQQLKLLGAEIVVVPCFTMSSYLSFRNYGVELIEMGTIAEIFLKEADIKNPLVLCSERTKKAGYCEKHFECRYPSESVQREFNFLIEEALRGEKIDLSPLLNKLPFVPIICASTVISAQMKEIQDPRLINLNKILAQYVVQRSYEGRLNESAVRSNVKAFVS